MTNLTNSFFSFSKNPEYILNNNVEKITVSYLRNRTQSVMLTNSMLSSKPAYISSNVCKISNLF